MTSTITLDDLINKVHHIIEYTQKKKITNDPLLNPILSVDDQINVKFFNEDMLSVFADNKTENMERYIINLDGAENRSFYYTKDGSQPWIG